MCPCGKEKESITHIMGFRYLYIEERDVLEDVMRHIDEYDVETFSVQDSSEKTIAISLEIDFGQKRRKRLMQYGEEKRNEHPNDGGVSSLGVGTVLRLERDAWSMVKTTKASSK